MDNVSREHYKRSICRQCIHTWKVNVDREVAAKMAKADGYASTYLKKLYLSQWKMYVIQEKENRHKEQRKTAMRDKVSGWLNEYRATVCIVERYVCNNLLILEAYSREQSYSCPVNHSHQFGEFIYASSSCRSNTIHWLTL